MSASEKERVIQDKLPDIQKLGILAGGGELPHILAEACEAQGIEPFLIVFEGHTDDALVHGRQHIKTRLGAVGTILKTLKSHNISDVCLIGKIRRPSLAEIRPDLKAAAFFAKNGVKALGDDGLLKALRDFLEGEGLCVHGVQRFASYLLAPIGVVGGMKPNPDAMIDIRRGVDVLKGMSGLDVGQAVIVQEGIVLGVEAIEGTDALIERCAGLHRKGRGGVLVKLCKDNQDRDLDLPTIGPLTIEMAARYGLSGVAVHAGHSLLLRKDELALIADKHKMFLIGIEP
ncbi:MAG: UDP-2,3-diacylglucosamine diphosphatase LpxI [Micavibrio sp.]|nr:UDP-2,3-diacylglucosamine diphosphatase LpxI [Micavibrio sp.]